MNKLDIQNIVEDILRLDPTLVSKKAEVEQLVSTMLAQKPNITVNEAFLSRLRSRLVEQMSESEQKSFSFGQLFISHKLVFAGALGCLTVGIVSASLLYGSVQHTRIAAFNGFGSFSVAAVEASPTAISAPFGLGGRSGLGSGPDNKMIAYPEDDYGMYKFRAPTSIPVPAESMPVYGYIPDANDVPKILGDTFFDIWSESFGSRFPHGSVRGESMSALFELGDRMYSISFDVDRGDIMVHRLMDSVAQDIQYRPLTKNDLLSEEKLKEIAQDFLDELNLGTAYADPVIVSTPVFVYTDESGATVEQVNDYVEVVFPVRVPEGDVFDADGAMPQGVRVAINVRDQAVDNVLELYASSLQSSTYALVTDIDRIAALASVGGQYGMWGQKISETIELKEPTLVYISMWKQDPSSRRGRLVFVPAYRFPIEYPASVVDRETRQKAITIPLEKELFEQAERDALARQNQDGNPIPMPFLRTTEAVNNEE